MSNYDRTTPSHFTHSHIIHTNNDETARRYRNKVEVVEVEVTLTITLLVAKQKGYKAEVSVQRSGIKASFLNINNKDNDDVDAILAF